jgi:hypothetical protein
MGAPNLVAAQRESEQRVAPSSRSLEKALGGAVAALGIAALVHVLIYLLMIVNRTKLLHPLIAGGATWLGRLAGLVAIAAVVHCAVVLTRWLLARRAAAFARMHLPESRPSWALWAGCLVPLVNLAWAPVYVLELAGREDRLARLRKPIVVWWVVWAVASGAALFATATSWTDDAQGIADNTVATVVAYLLGLAAVVTVARVVEGFEQRSMGRPAQHWVVVPDGRDATPTVPPEAPADTASPSGHSEPSECSGPETVATPAVSVGSGGREPAA